MRSARSPAYSGRWLGRVVVSRWWMVCAVCSAARLSTPAPPEPLPRLSDSANQLRSYKWTGEQSKPPFTLMSVFDTPSVHFHTDSNLGYTYRPSSLAVFDKVMRAVQYIADSIDRELATLGTNSAELLRRFSSSSSIYPHIANLGASTDLSVLRKLATLPDCTADRIAELELANAQFTAGTIGQEIAVLAELEKVLSEALDVTSTVQRFEVREYNLSATKLSELREVV